MGTNSKTKPTKPTGISVQTARASKHPFSVIDRHKPLSRPEFDVYDAIREAVPVVGAAIEKIIRLVGEFDVECTDKTAEKRLTRFLNAVPIGIASNGIKGFLDGYLDSLLMYGTAVGEMVVGSNGRLMGLYNAPLSGLEITATDDPFACKVAVREHNGALKEVRHPERILLSAAHPTADHPEGRSLLYGLPFVTGILLKIFDSVGTNFERIGNLRYAVTYRPANEADAAFGADRASEIAREWSEAMSDKDGVRDFVAVGDVDIKVIGADNQTLDCEVPVRQMLEQIVAKLGLPPFMLGLSWSSTERMSTQQADTLTSELEYYRGLLTPVIARISRAFLRGEGYTCDFKVVWNDITLQDQVEEARARLLRAQASQIEIKER